LLGYTTSPISTPVKVSVACFDTLEFGHDVLFVTQSDNVYFYGSTTSLMSGTYSGNPKLYGKGKSSSGNALSILFDK